MRRTNFFLYRTPEVALSGRDAARRLARAFGFERLDSNPMADDDGLTQVAVREAGPKTRYIPYTDRPIQWHTDGYYNAPDRQIRGFLLHCERCAAEGGESLLMDHEIAYILLRERDPVLAAALFDPEAMTVPANEADGRELREPRAGPVFSVDPADGALHMRYTARTRSIVWRDDAHVRDAAEALARILGDPASPYVVRHRLAPGEGVLCNNVLHGRTGFRDAPVETHDLTRAGIGPRDPALGRRLVWRARSYDRIAPA
ncbi:MAG: TauD/TfdA family dioxygenase [Rhodospirillales bacterium]|nr:TauD/TfdA family dioxygenase [Rhodospirillales bacterium]